MKQILMDDFIMTNRENIEEKIWNVYSMIRDESRTDLCFEHVVGSIIKTLVKKEDWWEYGLGEFGKYPEEVQKNRERFASGLKKLNEAIPESERVISDEELDEAIEALIKPEEFHRYGLTVLVPDDFIVYEEAYDPDYTWDC